MRGDMGKITNKIEIFTWKSPSNNFGQNPESLIGMDIGDLITIFLINSILLGIIAQNISNLFYSLKQSTL